MSCNDTITKSIYRLPFQRQFCFFYRSCQLEVIHVLRFRIPPRTGNHLCKICGLCRLINFLRNNFAVLLRNRVADCLLFKISMHMNLISRVLVHVNVIPGRFYCTAVPRCSRIIRCASCYGRPQIILACRRTDSKQQSSVGITEFKPLFISFFAVIIKG